MIAANTAKTGPDRASLYEWLAEYCEFWKERSGSELSSSGHITMGGARVALEFAELVRKYVDDSPDIDRVTAGYVMHAIEETADYAYRLAGHPSQNDKERMTAVVIAHGIPLALSLAGLYGRSARLIPSPVAG